MRLLFIRQYFPPERGAQRYIYDLAEAMGSRGHDVTVLTGLPNYPLGVPYEGFGRYRPDIRTENGMKVVRVPLLMASDRQPLRRILGFVSFAISALPWGLLLPEPDVILTHAPPVTVAPLGTVVAKLREIPLVMVLHDVVPKTHFDIRGIGDTTLARFTQRLFSRLYERADQIVVTHETQLQEMVELGTAADRIEVLTHGIDVARFAERAKLTVPFSLPRQDGRAVLLYTGSVGQHNYLESTIRAFADPAVRDLPVDVVIVGDGELAPLCERVIAEHSIDNVTMLPSIPSDWVPAVLSQADALLLSIKPCCDVYGSKFYEYLAAGRPLIANNSRSLARLIHEIGNGWAFDSAEPRTLELALKQFLAMSPEDRQRCGRLGQEYARTHFDAAARWQRWEDMLVEISRRRL